MSDLKKYLILFFAGLFIGLGLGALIDTQKVELKKDVSIKEFKNTEIVRGKEDTSTTIKFIKADNSPGEKYSSTPDPKKPEIKEETASWDTADQSGFIANIRYNITRNLWSNHFYIPQKAISRVDTVYKTHTIESVSKTETLVYELPRWSIQGGIKYYFGAGFDPLKHISITYTKNILLDFSVEAGFFNKLNDGLEGIKPFVEAEVRLRL